MSVRIYISFFNINVSLNYLMWQQCAVKLLENKPLLSLFYYLMPAILPSLLSALQFGYFGANVFNPSLSFYIASLSVLLIVFPKIDK